MQTLDADRLREAAITWGEEVQVLREEGSDHPRATWCLIEGIEPDTLARKDLSDDFKLGMLCGWIAQRDNAEARTFDRGTWTFGAWDDSDEAA
jgi:hypothetical protein